MISVVQNGGLRKVTMLNLFSHVGIVVRDIDQALGLWRDALGLTVVKDVHIPEEGVRSVFVSTGGAYGEATCIELLQPLPGDEDGPIARRLASHGEGVFHLAFRGSVPDETIEDMHARGTRTIALPPAGFEISERLVIHPQDANGVLIEVLEGKEI